MDMRKKVKLAFMVDDSSRKLASDQRNQGILKKVRELTALGGVPVCAIIYDVEGSKLELWPPSPVAVCQEMSKLFKISGVEQSKKKMALECFLLQWMVRAERRLRKQKKINKEREMIGLMYLGLDRLQDPGLLLRLGALDRAGLERVIHRALGEICQMPEKLRYTVGKEVLSVEANRSEMSM